jgi:Zn-dependent peptidase ImmA (M78 family)/transcriptional regulator with XRE-family HTH domain
VSSPDLLAPFDGDTDVFDGSQVTVARQLSGLTQVELGELIESRCKEDPAKRVRNWASGVHPSPPLLEQLAIATGVDAAFFFTPRRRIAPLQPPLFCKHTAATLRARSQAEGLIHLAEKVVCFAEDQTGKVIRPNLPTVENLRLEGDIAERAARLAREWMGLDDGPVDDVIGLAEQFGVLVAFSYGLRTDERALVILNPTDQDRYFMRFKFAHEIGHLVMHKGLDTKKLKKPVQREVEAGANRFAAEFLTPSRGVMSTLREARETNSWKGLFAAKEYWGVPVKSVIMRMSSLGLLNDDEYRTAMIRYQAHAGAHKRAASLERFRSGPSNPSWMNQSEPAKLKQLESVAAVPALIAQLGMTPQAISARLGFPAAYLAAMTATEPMDVSIPARLVESRQPGWSGSPLDFQDDEPDEDYR